MTSLLTEAEANLGPSPNETMPMIHFSRPGTIFAAVAASVFTAVGIAGKGIIVHTSLCFLSLSNPW